MAKEAENQPGVCDVTEGDKMFQEAGTGQMKNE